MIINFLLNIVVLVLSIIFGWLPLIEKLPSIVGYDIDTALSNGMGQLAFVISNVWPLQVFFQGFLFLMGYFVLKMVVKVFFGSRAPD